MRRKTFNNKQSSVPNVLPDLAENLYENSASNSFNSNLPLHLRREFMHDIFLILVPLFLVTRESVTSQVPGLARKTKPK